MHGAEPPEQPFGKPGTRPGSTRRVVGRERRPWAEWLGTLPMRLQIGMATGLLCALMVCVVSVGAAWIGSHQAEIQADLRLRRGAAEMAYRLDAALAQRVQEIGTLADLVPQHPPGTRATLADERILDGMFERLRARQPEYAWIGLADPGGLVQTANPDARQGVSVAESPWFRAALHEPALQDVHEAEWLGRLPPDADGPGSAAQRQARFFDIAFPLHGPDGRLLGVLGAQIDAGWLDGLRAAFHGAGAGLAGRESVQILSADGRVLIGPDAGRVVLEAPAALALAHGGPVVRTITEAGKRRLAGLAVTQGIAGSPGLGWIVLVSEAAGVAYAPVRAIVGAILALGALVACLGIALSCLLAGKVAGPIWRLCEEAERIGRSPQGGKLERARGSLEVLRLSRSLRSLVRRLGSTERQLVDAAERADASRARFFQQIAGLRLLADTDPMTGLLNRRGFLNAVSALPRRDGRGGTGVLIVDIDHFKAVNDRYGHATGDEVIRAVAASIQGTVRQSDIVARFGGEEFVVIVTQGAETLALLADRIRAASQQVVTALEAAVTVTVSIGGAVQDGNDTDIQDTIDRADAALYRAKEAGRNCVRISRSLVSDAGMMSGEA